MSTCFSDGKRVTLFLSLVLLVSLARGVAGQQGEATSAGGEETFETAEELYKAVEPFFSKNPTPEMGMKGAPPPGPDDEVLFVVRHLGSENPEVQEMAAELLIKLAELGWGPSQRPCMKYLSREYPLNVRLAAHVMASEGGWTREDLVVDGELVGKATRLKPHFVALLKDLANAPTTPRLLYALDEVDHLVTYSPVWQPLEEGEQRMLARRILASLGSYESKKRRKGTLLLLDGLDGDVAGSEVAAWYRLEPDRDVRELLFKAAAGLFSPLYAKPWRRTKHADAVLQLAAQDTDWRIARKARKHLKRR